MRSIELSRLLDFAIEIADHQNAHILGLYVIPAVQVYPSVTIDAVIAGFRGLSRVLQAPRAPSEEDSFDSCMRRSGLSIRMVPCAWRDAACGGRGHRAWHGRRSDHCQPGRSEATASASSLISSSVSSWGSGVHSCWFQMRRLPERFGGKVLIGWNGTREAARAAFDAIPLLQQAEAVTITWVDPQKTLEAPRTVPCAELATALDAPWHHDDCGRFSNGRPDAGQALKMRALDLGADLLVMGAYGHTRISEFVFGGATDLHAEKDADTDPDVALKGR